MDRRKCYRPSMTTTLILIIITLCKLHGDIWPSPTVLNDPPTKIDNDGRVSNGTDDHSGLGSHRLAILIPYRNCESELRVLVPHLHTFLNRQKIAHKFYVINQDDHFRFNRAYLLNIGFLESQSDCDYLALHDVDLLPLNNDLSYGYPPTGVSHLSPPHLHPVYHYRTFVGGILLMTHEYYKMIDGLSNLYWGWGKEDDELALRMRESKTKIETPKNITTGTKNTFKHIHNSSQRHRDNNQYYNQRKLSFKRERTTGASTTKYNIKERKDLNIENIIVTFLSVELQCDLEVTPWCVTPFVYKQVMKYINNTSQGLPKPEGFHNYIFNMNKQTIKLINEKPS